MVTGFDDADTTECWRVRVLPAIARYEADMARHMERFMPALQKLEADRARLLERIMPAVAMEAEEANIGRGAIAAIAKLETQHANIGTGAMAAIAKLETQHANIGTGAMAAIAKLDAHANIGAAAMAAIAKFDATLANLGHIVMPAAMTLRAGQVRLAETVLATAAGLDFDQWDQAVLATVRAAGEATSAGSANASVVRLSSEIEWWRRTWDDMDRFERLTLIVAVWIVGQLLLSSIQAAADPTVPYNPSAALSGSARGIYDNIIAALLVMVALGRRTS